MKIKKISQSAGLIANVADSLNSNSTVDALSANQGKILNEKIEGLNIPKATEVVDNLTSSSSTSALSARQGKILSERMDNLNADAIIDVDVLPAITEENKNNIIRYNGELYAVAEDFTELAIQDDVQTITLEKEAELIFNYLPPFLGVEDVPFTSYRDNKRYTRLVKIIANNPDDTIDVLMYHPDGDNNRLFVGRCFDIDSETFDMPVAGYYTGIDGECISGALMFTHSENNMSLMTLQPGTYTVQTGGDLNWEFSQSYRIRYIEEKWIKINSKQEESSEILTCYFEHGGIITPIKYMRGATWDGFDNYIVNASQHRGFLTVTEKDGIYIMDGQHSESPRWKVTNSGKVNCYADASFFEDTSNFVIQPNMHYILEPIYILDGDLITSYNTDTHRSEELPASVVNSYQFFNLKVGRDKIRWNGYGELPILQIEEELGSQQGVYHLHRKFKCFHSDWGIKSIDLVMYPYTISDEGLKNTPVCVGSVFGYGPSN